MCFLVVWWHGAAQYVQYACSFLYFLFSSIGLLPPPSPAVGVKDNEAAPRESGDKNQCTLLRPPTSYCSHLLRALPVGIIVAVWSRLFRVAVFILVIFPFFFTAATPHCTLTACACLCAEVLTFGSEMVHFAQATETDNGSYNSTRSHNQLKLKWARRNGGFFSCQLSMLGAMFIICFIFGIFHDPRRTEKLLVQN